MPFLLSLNPNSFSADHLVYYFLRPANFVRSSHFLASKYLYFHTFLFAFSLQDSGTHALLPSSQSSPNHYALQVTFTMLLNRQPCHAVSLNVQSSRDVLLYNHLHCSESPLNLPVLRGNAVPFLCYQISWGSSLLFIILHFIGKCIDTISAMIHSIQVLCPFPHLLNLSASSINLLTWTLLPFGSLLTNPVSHSCPFLSYLTCRHSSRLQVLLSPSWPHNSTPRHLVISFHPIVQSMTSMKFIPDI